MEKNNYKIVAAESGENAHKAKVIKEFFAPSQTEAANVLAEVLKDPKFMFTHAWIEPITN